MYISFEPIRQSHLHLLLKWLMMPHVQQFWDTGTKWTEELVQENYGSYIAGYKVVDGVRKPMQAYILSVENKPIGYIQLYNVFDFPWEGFDPKDICHDLSKPLVAIDFFIGEPDYIGIGVGSNALRVFLQSYVFPYFDACLVDPDKANIAAIKSYTKAGFTSFQDLGSSIIMIAKREVCK